MLRPQKPIGVVCPSCLKHLAVPRPYILGDTQWSDGYWGTKIDQQWDLSSCPVCQHVFWRQDAQKIELDPKAVPGYRVSVADILAAAGWDDPKATWPVSSDAEFVEQIPLTKPATAHQQIALLSGGGLPIEREWYLRTRLWHTANHSQRGITVDPSDTIPEVFRLENLRWLLNGYESKPSDDRDIVIEGELLRELGQFDEALERMEIAIQSGSTRALAIQAEILDGSTSICVIRQNEGMAIF